MTEPYYEDGGLTLYHGKCEVVLKELPDDHFDSVVCDPPYELGFMGKGWDASGIAFDVDMWAEVLRVLKPGGYVLAFGGTRTYHRMAVAIEDAGFELRDSIAWLYGQGFPKSMDVSKAIDKAAGAEREVLATVRKTPSAGGENTHEGWKRPWAEGKTTMDITAPSTDEAKEWAGWGTALKPAFEPIVMGRKPIIGTVAANVLKHGTGAIHIDAVRVGDEMTERGRAGRSTTSDKGAVDLRVKPTREGEASAERRYSDAGGTNFAALPGVRGGDPAGRWPTNVLLDQSQAEDLDAQTGVLTSGKVMAHHADNGKAAGILGGMAGAPGRESYGDSGGASRFFPTFRYEAKAPTSERPDVGGEQHSTVKPLDLMRWLVRLVTMVRPAQFRVCRRYNHHCWRCQPGTTGRHQMSDTTKPPITTARVRMFYEHATSWVMPGAYKEKPKKEARLARVREVQAAEFDAWLAEHDAAVGAQAIRDEANAIAGYTLNFESGQSMYDHVLRLLRRDADTLSPVVGSTPEGQTT